MFSHRTLNYAAPPRGVFWQWSADHDAVEWYDGSTLAMWPELHGVLHFLGEDGGLPPFGAILLLLAACRDGWLEKCVPFHGKVMEILGVTKSDAIPLEIKDTLVRGLKVVNDLPKDLRASLPAKCLLVSTLFAGGPHSLPKEESALILRELSIHGPLGFRRQLPKMDAKARFSRDVRALRVGLARHDGASLEALLRTGLENLSILGADIPEPPSRVDDTTPLLDRLKTLGGESGAAAAVAKRAIAMMNLPGMVGTPRDLPVGGISDITNRGTVDRLLPGELAWDDLVLAARLVHNEALYFRREIPPLDVAVSHTVLLDRGLRLWGTGRVFSLGVALGLRHHPVLNRSGESFECLAATHDGLTALDLATPVGVLSALEALIPAASPDAFLTVWWDSALAADDSTIPDLSFITAREHLEVSGTRNLLGDIAGWIHGKSGRFRVIALGRAGDVSVQEWSPGGIRESFHGEIDLDEIFQAPEHASAPELSPPPLRAKPDPLHALLPVYGQNPFPFLFPVIPQGSAILAEGEMKFIGVSQLRNLMEWPKKGWAAHELVRDVPGRQHWMARDDHNEPIIIASGKVPGENVRVFRYRDRQLTEIQIADSMHAFPHFATVSGGAVLLAYTDSVEAISLGTGKQLAVLRGKKLPAIPIIDFDGSRIHVHIYDSGKKPGSSLDGWPFGDVTWPRLFHPDRVALVGHSLLLADATTVYQFNPVELNWKEVNSSSAAFADFKRDDSFPTSGISLWRAQLGSGHEAWLDDRGIVHLRKEGHAPWSILCTTSNTAVWNESWGLCAFEKRLRLPGVPIPGELVLRDLSQFLQKR